MVLIVLITMDACSDDDGGVVGLKHDETTGSKGIVVNGLAVTISSRLAPALSPTVTPTATVTATPTLRPTARPILTAGALYEIEPIVGPMRYIPAGSFVQGSPEDEPCRGFDEKEWRHRLTRNCAIMETEVTRTMWSELRAVQATLPAEPTNPDYSPELVNPVNQATWYETILFANLLSVQNGFERCYYADSHYSIPIDVTNYTLGPFYCNFYADGYRLLSEGEWEYAVRAGTVSPFSCSEFRYKSENCWVCNSGCHPVLEQYVVFCASANGQNEPVGGRLANPWRLKDMHGNISEWCWDYYGMYPQSARTDYTGPDGGSLRICRGGNWHCYPHRCRSAFRDYLTPDSRSGDIGFRLARTLGF